MIAIEESEGADPVTVSSSDVECDRVPPSPLIVMVTLPTTAEPPTVRVRVDDPEPAGIVMGANCAVTPDGMPVAESATPEENPPTAAELTVSDALDPRGTEMLVGTMDSMKSGTGVPLTV